MFRYLINLSYIGTQFRGIQKNLIKGSLVSDDTSSVEGVLEIALRKLHPINDFKIKLSSRTDAGVHALHNTVHVDLERCNGRPYDEEQITRRLNRSFASQALSIRILSTQLVPMTFHARMYAKSRTYIYRLGLLRQQFCVGSGQHPLNRFVPIEEHDRCYFISHEHFDIERLKRVASSFEGYHDFRTFMATSRGNERQLDPSFTLRRIQSITIERGTCMASAFNRDLAEKFYDYWDIRIKGRSFLYKQVRRMVGAWIAAAAGRITERDVYEMLTIPSSHSWCDQSVVVPAYGLYLCHVEYDPADLSISLDELPRSTTVEETSVATN
ncbi:tRNA pseudouridine synthase-like 1 [Topomyia yanbarensis]|uniref:tRNA pseudouridine synthase-like 1 n=1 Tax=Topomyia yanbarensis TaxID=2498891 RepID=UPI00273BC9A0|nr:tRNA pseudouridine synthase-like 1 [Topomyia yanbarensis]